MWEKTLRYPGHVAKINVLKALGFFDEHPIEIKNVRITPREMTSKLLEERLQRPDIKDLLVMRVRVCGVSGGSERCFVYNLLDRFDEIQGVTAMARTTAYPASIMAQLIMENRLKEPGVYPLEKLGSQDIIYKRMLKELGRRGIKISEC